MPYFVYRAPLARGLPKCREKLSKSLIFLIFCFKSSISRFRVCSNIGLAQLSEAFSKICFFFQRKRNFFFTFSQSLMRSSPTFYDNEKCALMFEISQTEKETVWNDAPKKLFNIFSSTFATFFKSCKIKNLNLWLQRNFDSETEVHLLFLLILLPYACKMKFWKCIKYSQIL